MATANLVSPLVHTINPHFLYIQSPSQLLLVLHTSSQNGFPVIATCTLGNDFLGDFGAKDPFPAELESGFGEEMLGNIDTGDCRPPPHDRCSPRVTIAHCPQLIAQRECNIISLYKQSIL